MGAWIFTAHFLTALTPLGGRHTGRHVLLAKEQSQRDWLSPVNAVLTAVTGCWLSRSLTRGFGLRAQICDLLLVLAHGDAAVKAALARPGVLRALCAAAARLPAPAQLKCLKCLKHLSGDPGMLEPMQARAPACCAGRGGPLGAFSEKCAVQMPVRCKLASVGRCAGATLLWVAGKGPAKGLQVAVQARNCAGALPGSDGHAVKPVHQFSARKPRRCSKAKCNMTALSLLSWEQPCAGITRARA